MVKRQLLLSFCWLFMVVSVAPETRTAAQETEPRIQVVVNLVQLNVAVTDAKGNYITGLRPQDFSITEDGIPERIATFAEGNEPTRRLVETAGEGRSSDGQDGQGGAASVSAKDPPATLGSL